MNQYLAALTDPFGEEAIGAQVPDMYSFPTETQMVRAIFTIGNDSLGNLDFIITPSIFQSIICGNPLVNATQGNCPNRSVANIGGIFIPDFTPTSGVQVQVAPVSSPTLSLNVGSWMSAGVVDPDVVDGQFQRYRIVGMGCRIACLAAPLNQQGKLVFASFPSPRLSFPQGLAGNTGSRVTTASTASYATVCQWLDLPWPDAAGYATNEIINVPEAKSITVADLAVNGSIQWVNKPTASGNVGFRDSFNNIQVTNSLTLGETLSGVAGASTAFTISNALTAIGSNALTGATVVSPGFPPQGALLASGGLVTLAGFPVGTQVLGYDETSGGVYLSANATSIQTTTGVFNASLPGVSGNVIDPDYYRIDGWETLVVRGSAMGTVVNACQLTVEVIYHVEGCPYVSGAVGTFINGGEAPPVDPLMYQRAIQAASEQPFFTRVNNGNDDFTRIGRKRRSL
jgi:hypothetical protein